jgi:hypothetical protein
MPGSWPPHELPYLTDDTCRVTSRAVRRYNCIAWAAGNDQRNWWPDPMGVGYWPPTVAREVSVEAFMHAYETLGYTLCLNGSLENGVEKMALFGIKEPDGSTAPTHAALQLETGEWTSKLGPFEDVIHTDVNAANGPVYGKVILYMARPRR